MCLRYVCLISMCLDFDNVQPCAHNPATEQSEWDDSIDSFRRTANKKNSMINSFEQCNIFRIALFVSLCVCVLKQSMWWYTFTAICFIFARSPYHIVHSVEPFAKLSSFCCISKRICVRCIYTYIHRHTHIYHNAHK